MKKLFTLTVLLLSGLLATAQVSKSGLNDRVILVGNPCLNNATKHGLYTAHLERRTNQIALVAAEQFTCTYYAIYSAHNKLLAEGEMKPRYAGDIVMVDFSAKPDNYTIVFYSSPVTACNP